jgi:hypothetical protein
MYGLERFGDYLMKMSYSRNANKHVSICKRYMWRELCTFLYIDNPAEHEEFTQGQFVQPHMFSLSQIDNPSLWTVDGDKSAAVIMSAKDAVELANMYIDQDLLSYPATYPPLSREAHSPFDRDCLQIRGHLWCGTRYFEMYYEGYDHEVLGRGNCCVVLPDLKPDRLAHLSFDGAMYGIVRNIVQHRIYPLATCSLVFFFQVELLQVSASSTDLPLPDAVATKELVWVSQFDVREHASTFFCLRCHDDDDTKFYFIELN